jgi:hypothetical protein
LLLDDIMLSLDDYRQSIASEMYDFNESGGPESVSDLLDRNMSLKMAILVKSTSLILFKGFGRKQPAMM